MTNIESTAKWTVKLIGSTLLTMQTMCMYAQSFTYDSHAPKSGDNIELLELDYFDAGNSGNNVIWDFSDLNVKGNESTVGFCTEADSTLLFFNDTGIFHLKLDDGLFLLKSMESRLNSITYKKPLTIYSFPLAYGYSHFEDYTAFGKYCETIAVDATGSMSVDADACGSIINCLGDTIRDVLRVHTIKTEHKTFHTLADSLSRQEEKDNNKLEIEEVYLWNLIACMDLTFTISMHDSMTATWDYSLQLTQNVKNIIQ